jgi:hypothetical protein
MTAMAVGKMVWEKAEENTLTQTKIYLPLVLILPCQFSRPLQPPSHFSVSELFVRDFFNYQ